MKPISHPVSENYCFLTVYGHNVNDVTIGKLTINGAIPITRDSMREVLDSVLAQMRSQWVWSGHSVVEDEASDGRNWHNQTQSLRRPQRET